MAKPIVSDIESEMISLLNQLTELNGRGLEDNPPPSPLPSPPVADEGTETDEPSPLTGEQYARLVLRH